MYLFTYKTTKSYKGKPLDFKCILKQQKCTVCSKNVSIGIPLCTTHLSEGLWLKVKASDIKAAGNGLFAWNKELHAQGKPLFKKGDHITDYEGEIITKAEEDRRYGKQNTAPYAFSIGNTKYSIDASCYRCVASLINHDPKRTNVTASFPEKGVIEIRAKKNIYHNEELFLNYGKQYKFDNYTTHKTSHIKQTAAKKLIQQRAVYDARKVKLFENTRKTLFGKFSEEPSQKAKKQSKKKSSGKKKPRRKGGR